MQIRFLLMGLLWGLLWIARPALARENDQVRVRLMAAQTNLNLYGWGLSHHASDYLPVSLPAPSENLSVQRVSLVQKGQRVWMWKIEVEGRTELSGGPFLQIFGQALQAGREAWPTHLLLAAGRGARADQFDVVGILPLEEYLVGVLAGEVPASWPMEALKAQATAARSYTLSVMRERKNRPYQLESDTRDQMFKFSGPSPRPYSKGLERIREAVIGTRGLVLSNSKNDQPVKAFYHADCGGRLHTERNVWAHSGSTVQGLASCPDHPHQHWELSLSASRLEKALHAWTGGTSAIVRLVLTSEGGLSVPNELVQLQLADGSRHSIPADQFRSLLGYDQLKSTTFSATYDSETLRWKFVGVGFGHGVGLCQSGARSLADHKKNFREILSIYFPGSHLVQLASADHVPSL